MDKTVQIIPDDWEERLQGHFTKIDNARLELTVLSPLNEGFAAASGALQEACQKLVTYVETNFGSAMEFQDFLKALVLKDAQGKNIPVDTAEIYLNWPIISENMGDVALAKAISQDYMQNYKTALSSVEKVANFNSFVQRYFGKDQ